MKQSNILIWDKGLTLENIGGPSGYLYNIYSYCQSHPQEKIKFYSDMIKTRKSDNGSNLKNKLKKIGLHYPSIVQKLKCLHNHLYQNLQLTNDEVLILNKFDYVHFHSFIQARAYLNDIKTKCSNIKIILTTHTPEPYCDEYCNTVGIKWLIKIPFVRTLCIQKETKCFEMVDYIMFPVPEVIEVYSSKSLLYKDVLEKAKNKTFYVPTAILDNVTPRFENYLSKYYLKKSLRACYVGRHNEIKGYDFLKKIAQESWKRELNVTYLIGGSQNGIASLNDPRWIELGWVNTINLLQEVDLFILPNKQTYYDLILLEVIRAAKPVLLTRTGGNKHFLQYKCPGLLFCDYGNVSQACEQIKKIIEYKNTGVLNDFGMKNRDLFIKTSTVSIYINNYLQEINNLNKINQ